METGKLKRNNGLCNENLPLVSYLKPTLEDKEALEQEGISTTYWGSGLSDQLFFQGDRLETEFTPLRQTIVLFLAAMNEEL